MRDENITQCLTTKRILVMAQSHARCEGGRAEEEVARRRKVYPPTGRSRMKNTYAMPEEGMNPRQKGVPVSPGQSRATFTGLSSGNPLPLPPLLKLDLHPIVLPMAITRVPGQGQHIPIHSVP